MQCNEPLQDYKEKVHNCRNMLLDKFRGTLDETELRDTLMAIYKSMFVYPKFEESDEESEVFNEIKKELIEEEIQWFVHFSFIICLEIHYSFCPLR